MTVTAMCGRIKNPSYVITAIAAKKGLEERSGESGSYWDLC